MAQLVFRIFFRWIVIYPVVSAIQCLNNWGQKVIGLNPIVISWIVSSKLPVTEKKKTSFSCVHQA